MHGMTQTSRPSWEENQTPGAVALAEPGDLSYDEDELPPPPDPPPPPPDYPGGGEDPPRPGGSDG